MYPDLLGPASSGFWGAQGSCREEGFLEELLTDKSSGEGNPSGRALTGLLEVLRRVLGWL